MLDSLKDIAVMGFERAVENLWCKTGVWGKKTFCAFIYQPSLFEPIS